MLRSQEWKKINVLKINNFWELKYEKLKNVAETKHAISLFVHSRGHLIYVLLCDVIHAKYKINNIISIVWLVI